MTGETLPAANATAGATSGATPGAVPGAAPGAAPAMELANAARWYGNVVAVNDVSFSLGAGVTGLLGPNGAGKTTLLHMLAGFLAPSAGTVHVLGRSPHRDPSVYRQIGLVPERESVYAFLTGFEYVRFNARLQGMRNADSAARAAIARVGLEDAADRAIGTYSKGMRQRAKVAGALVHDPQVLLLDEPFNGMDPRQRLAMMDLLGEMARRGPDDPLLLAHPRGGRADRHRDPGHGRRPARRFGGLQGHPGAHDGSAAQHHDPLERRSQARDDPDGRPRRLRRGASARTPCPCRRLISRRSGESSRRPAARRRCG